MNFDLLLQISYLFLATLIFAALEVQIEGKEGWAARLPTKRLEGSGWFLKIYKQILFGKDTTLYHLLIFTLLLSFLHYPYFTGKNWNWGQEAGVVSLFFLMSVFWDFLWFLINPHYGFSKFKPGNIRWHKKWFLRWPLDYWFGIALSFLLYVRLSFDLVLVGEWAFIFTSFSVFVLITAIVKSFPRAVLPRRGRQ